MQTRYWYILIGLTMMLACTQDRMPDLISLDIELESLLTDAAERAATARGEFSNEGMDFYILPDENDLSKIPQDSKNPLTPSKVELGKLLFFETGFATQAKDLSGMGTYSCGSCHIPEAGFKPGNTQGIADGGVGYGTNGDIRLRSSEYIASDLDAQSARPLSLLNVAFVKNTTWNGRFGAGGENLKTEAYWKDSDGTSLNSLGFEAIETQNFKGLETHRIGINIDVIDAFGYRDLFDEAFPDLEDDLKYSNYGGSLAISAYIRTLLTNRAPFQDWLKGDRDALSTDEKKGAILFFGEAKCGNCHYNENLGSGEFHALGVKDLDMRASFQTSPAEVLDRNLGRGAFTGLVEDNYKFKVPQLYNLTDAPHYFHGSSIRELADVIEYKNAAQSESDRIPQNLVSEKFRPLELNEEEKAQLLLFISKSLNDPNLLRYKPTEILSGQCFPNNDPRSRADIGCNEPVDPTITYTSDILPIISQSCGTGNTQCHGANSTLTFPMTTYDETVAAVNSNRVKGAINRETGFAPMPKDGDKLTQTSINLITDWIDSGAPR